MRVSTVVALFGCVTVALSQWQEGPEQIPQFPLVEESQGFHQQIQGSFRPNDQLPCGFSCTRQAQWFVIIDGKGTTATCSSGNNLDSRCDGCCKSKGLSEGISSENAAGFPSTDRQTCVCCFVNRAGRCGRG